MNPFVFVLAVLFALVQPAFAQQAAAPAPPPAAYGAKATVFTGGTFAPDYIGALAPQSGKEQLLISFYRTADKAPDFRRWSYMTDKSQKAADYDRSVVALNEQVRLQTVFENTDAGDFLVIHAPLDVSRYSATQDILFLPAFARGGTLTQQVFGEKLALIVPDLTKFQMLHMTNEDASLFFRSITEDGTKKEIQARVIAEMIVKPRRAVFRKQSRIGKDDHYMFTLDLARLTIWRAGRDDEDHSPMWTWQADWYRPNTDSPQLLQLYKAIN